MKVCPLAKKMCYRCQLIKRSSRMMVICSNLKYKQRQG